MSEKLRPCPFCGGTKICTEKGINLNYCDNCSAESNIEHWNTRPIEDALQAENEWLKEELQQEKTRSQLNLEAEERRMLNITYYCAEIDRLNARIAELEGKIDQLTAHSDIERQDDKSSNDTQKETFVYGKDSKPLPCPLCGNIVDGKESR